MLSALAIMLTVMQCNYYLFIYLLFLNFRYTTLAKMVDTDSGNLFIVGSFNKHTDPDFKVSNVLVLLSNVHFIKFINCWTVCILSCIYVFTPLVLFIGKSEFFCSALT